MKTNVLFLTVCLVLCLGSAACRSTAEADVEAVGLSEVLEIDDCVLSEPCVLVTRDVLETLPDPVRIEAEKYCSKPGTAVVASGLRPRYFRLIRGQRRLVLGSDETNSLRNTVFLSVIGNLGEAADSIRSIKTEKTDSPDPWDLGVFIGRYPELAGRIAELPPDDERLAELRPAARELLSRGSTKVMLERHSRVKVPAALDAAVRAEEEQIGVLEAILDSK